MRPGERRALVDRDDPDLSIMAQCQLLKVARSTLSMQWPAGEAPLAFCLVAGISTAGRSMRLALRMRVSMSAIGSDVVIRSCSSYQLALITPGTSPASARARKQMRHSLNFRKYPRGRPQIRQRLRMRILNFGFRFIFAN